MSDKKKYDLGSIELVERKKNHPFIYASIDDDIDAPEFYPINGDADFSDTEKFNRIAMAGPFTSP